MNEIFDTVIVFFVFRLFFYIVEVWWNGTISEETDSNLDI